MEWRSKGRGWCRGATGQALGWGTHLLKLHRCRALLLDRAAVAMALAGWLAGWLGRVLGQGRQRDGEVLGATLRDWQAEGAQCTALTPPVAPLCLPMQPRRLAPPKMGSQQPRHTLRRRTNKFPQPEERAPRRTLLPAARAPSQPAGAVTWACWSFGAEPSAGKAMRAEGEPQPGAAGPLHGPTAAPGASRRQDRCAAGRRETAQPPARPPTPPWRAAPQTAAPLFSCAAASKWPGA